LMEYYSTMNSNEVLIHTTTWMNMKTWTERSQSQKVTYVVWLHL
jgi:hypothetical protein